MAKSLVIVESPAKAKTINRYLGAAYEVRSSIGHIRDLPASGRKNKAKKASGKAGKTGNNPRRRLIENMGIDPDAHWLAHYEIMPGKEKVVQDLRRAAARADNIYLATDRDREGEAIAWHLREAIGGDPGRYRRVVFNEITRRAIDEAFAHPGELDMNRVNAQQVRRFLDRLVGYMLSPLLWKKIARGLSAGRVQSVAVRLIVEREKEIRAFVPEEYWDLFAYLVPPGLDEPLKFQVFSGHGEKFRPINEAAVEVAMQALRDTSYQVTQRKNRPTSVNPAAPFITSTMQQAASTKLRFGVKKTMILAQRLYEAGHITYMRTDSTNLSMDAIAAARAFIDRRYGQAYVPNKPVIYASREQAQEAHEAIRPSDCTSMPDDLPGDLDARRLYELIWQRFIACQMPPAKYVSTTIVATAADYEMHIRGRVLRFDGFTRVQPAASKREEDRQLPDLQEGDKLSLRRLEPVQHFTKAPPRYGEASLVGDLEKRGIGRPSTYAAIISTIQERGYVSLIKGRFHAEKIGDIVTIRLIESFADLMDYSFTAGMERLLDAIADGEKDWRTVLDEFYAGLSERLDRALGTEGGMRGNRHVLTDIACPSCARPMLIRTGTTGVFLGCSGYGLQAGESCTKTMNLIPNEEMVDADAGDEAESLLLRAMRRCSQCSAAMVPYLIDATRRLHICGNNPDCAGQEVESGNFGMVEPERIKIECDKCGADMELKSGRFGKYFDCLNANCKNTRKLLASGQPAPPKMDPVPMPELRCLRVNDHYVLRDGAAGLFLAASLYPKHRETRPPLVGELLPHGSEIDPKYRYVLDAPTADPDGNPTSVRFSRKLQQQFVTTEKDGKPTGWQAYYQDGEWRPHKAVKAPARKKAASAGARSAAKKSPATRKMRR